MGFKRAKVKPPTLILRAMLLLMLVHRIGKMDSDVILATKVGQLFSIVTRRSALERWKGHILMHYFEKLCAVKA